MKTKASPLLSSAREVILSKKVHTTGGSRNDRQLASQG